MTFTSQNEYSNSNNKRFRIRTVTAFVNLKASDFSDKDCLRATFDSANRLIRSVEHELKNNSYEVQTVRIATNPFGEWLMHDTLMDQLAELDAVLETIGVQFCALGPACNVDEVRLCPTIIAASLRFSCSANAIPTGIENAKEIALCIIQISKMDEPEFLRGGLGNFRFCAAASCKPCIPFFPVAKSCKSLGEGLVGFAIGLENGALAQDLLAKSRSIENIRTTFGEGITAVLAPVQAIAERVALFEMISFFGIDTSLNPSLDEGGSVAEAIECLEEVRGVFGGPGTLAAAAAITTTLQSLAGIKSVGYCGLMLPICEDRRLAQIASFDWQRLQMSNILSISSVCGVGVDTVPIPGDCSEAELSSLILDVAALAGRWNKSLSCRVFPVPGSNTGDMTDFNSPYLCNTKIFSLQ